MSNNKLFDALELVDSAGNMTKLDQIGFTNTLAGINVQWQQINNLEIATSAVVAPDTANIFAVNNTFEANDNYLAKTRVATLSALPSVPPSLVLNDISNGLVNTINSTGYTTKNSVQNSTHYLNFSDNSSTGIGPIQKTAGISCNPSTNIITATTFNGALSGTATTATNIAGGLGGSIPYQSAVNTTALLANGTAGQVLTSQGTTLAPTWTTAAGSAGTLQQTLDLGNTATGANALIGLTNSGVGYTSNPQLTLNNSNATAGATTGIPSVEYYKSGRNAVATDIIGSNHFYAKNYAGTKTEFAKIEAGVRNTASGNDDGSIGMFATLNGVMSEFFRFNGADAENNSFYPIDMNNQAIKSSTGNLTLASTSSTGTGDITASAKGKVLLTAVSGSTTLPVNSLALSSGNTITLTNGNEANGLPENKIEMTATPAGTNNQIAMSVNDDGGSVYSRFYFGLQGSQFSICEAGGAGDGTNVWDIPANNTGNITMFRSLDFTFGSVSSGKVGVLEKSGINSTTTGTLDITGNRFNTTILTPNAGGMVVNITTPIVVGYWWGICNKSVVGSIDIQLNGVSQLIFTNANALLGSTIRVAAVSTTALYIV